MEELLELEKKTGYKFKNRALLAEALTHPSYPGDGHNVPDYERLEFLGDAVLELIVSEFLYKNFPGSDEGEMTKMRTLLVNREALGKDAEKLNLGKYLLLGKGEEKSGGHQRSSILSNALEAVFGAIFIDGGYEKAREIAEKIILKDAAEKLKNLEENKNYKSLFQEYVQKKFHTLPVYIITDEMGPPHQKVFEVEVKVGEKTMGKGKGKSIKEAQLSAAEHALKELKGKG